MGVCWVTVPGTGGHFGRTSSAALEQWMSLTLGRCAVFDIFVDSFHAASAVTAKKFREHYRTVVYL